MNTLISISKFIVKALFGVAIARYALIHLLERGVKIKNVLEPLRTNIGWVGSR